MKKLLSILALIAAPILVTASEADLVIPDGIKSETILYWGFLITFAGFLFGLYQFMSVKKIRAHHSMLDVAQVIYETGKTYLIQQGKFLAILFVFIGAAVAFYFGFLSQHEVTDPATKPERMFNEAPPFLEASTTSFTCVDFGLVKSFVNSGINAAPSVPALIITDKTIHILLGKLPITK